VISHLFIVFSPPPELPRYLSGEVWFLLVVEVGEEVLAVVTFIVAFNIVIEQVDCQSAFDTVNRCVLAGNEQVNAVEVAWAEVVE